ncbi:hypothetical protein [Herbiconiux daphne]|uniref:Tachylectin 2 domain-containing protein n=1 Tax=Herbiconiux daphne TaxID=2970914 RepID=A0ABT2H569_9MICO|nr:hypothetical protein [Herbiconiux daphne]MCS5735084.1 hypothetical protein [Herbiconiux daphne]
MAAYNGVDYNFVRGNDGQIWWNYRLRWENIPGLPSNTRTNAAPVAVVHPRLNQLWLFHTGTSGQVFVAAYDGSSWTPWSQQEPAGQLDPTQSVAVVSAEGQIWYTYRQNSTEKVQLRALNRYELSYDAAFRRTAEGGFDSRTRYAPSIATNSQVALILAHVGTDNRVYTGTFAWGNNYPIMPDVLKWKAGDVSAIEQPALYTANNTWTYAVVKGLDGRTWGSIYNYGENRLHSGWVISNESALNGSAPIVARNHDWEERVYITANPDGRIFHRPVAFNRY